MRKFEKCPKHLQKNSQQCKGESGKGMGESYQVFTSSSTIFSLIVLNDRENKPKFLQNVSTKKE